METQDRPRMTIPGNDDVERQGLTEKPPPPAHLEATVCDATAHPAFFIVSWIFFSNCTILLNKYLIDKAGFRYPIILTTWHLIFATLATQLLARTTTLLDNRKLVPLTGRLYLRAIIPIGLCYSASLVCSNLTYLYLSVPFIQMLKAAAPVAVLFVAWLWGVENPTLRRVLNVCIVVLGVVLASVGEVAFVWTGVLFQVGGIVFEAMRLVMVQVLLSEDKGDGRRGAGMDPLVGLYYYAPVCAVMNLFVAAVVEWPSFDAGDVGRAGAGMLFLSGVVAFMLNVASVFVIGKTSGLAMCLTGILKNILLVIASVVIWHDAITPLQVLGYAIACFGLVYYSIGWEQMVAQSAVGWAHAKKVWDGQTAEDSGTSIGIGNGISISSVQLRRVIIVGLALLTVGLLWLGLSSGSEEVAAVTNS